MPFWRHNLYQVNQIIYYQLYITNYIPITHNYNNNKNNYNLL